MPATSARRFLVDVGKPAIHVAILLQRDVELAAGCSCIFDNQVVAEFGPRNRPRMTRAMPTAVISSDAATNDVRPTPPRAARRTATAERHGRRHRQRARAASPGRRCVRRRGQACVPRATAARLDDIAIRRQRRGRPFEQRQFLTRLRMRCQIRLDLALVAFVESVQKVTDKEFFHRKALSFQQIAVSQFRCQSFNAGSALHVSCNRANAVCSLDFTVPTGMPRISATSLYFSP